MCRWFCGVALLICVAALPGTKDEHCVTAIRCLWERQLCPLIACHEYLGAQRLCDGARRPPGPGPVLILESCASFAGSIGQALQRMRSSRWLKCLLLLRPILTEWVFDWRGRS